MSHCRTKCSFFIPHNHWSTSLLRKFYCLFQFVIQAYQLLTIVVSRNYVSKLSEFWINNSYCIRPVIEIAFFFQTSCYSSDVMRRSGSNHDILHFGLSLLIQLVQNVYVLCNAERKQKEMPLMLVRFSLSLAYKGLYIILANDTQPVIHLF